MARSARRPGRQAQVPRLLVAAAAVALLLACASVGTPPGGPPDKEPPKIVAVKPESGAVVPDFHGDAAIQFNEVVDEMAGGGGAGSISGLAKQGLLSPVAGPVKVSWHRSRVTIKPKEGWKRRGYIVYGTADETNARRRGLRESYDSVEVTLDSSSNVALFAFPHDTVPPRPRVATYVDSISVRVEFSQALDPAKSLDTTHVHLL